MAVPKGDDLIGGFEEPQIQDEVAVEHIVGDVWDELAVDDDLADLVVELWVCDQQEDHD